MKKGLYHDVLDSQKGGIYKLINLITGLVYIGSAGCFRVRWYEHKRELDKHDHSNKYLQRAWDKYGIENFKFEIIEIIENPTKKSLEEREQYWMDYYKSYEKDKGYNLCKKAYSKKGVPSCNKGIKRTPEEIINIRRALLSKRHSPEEVEILLLKPSQSEVRKNSLGYSEAKKKYWKEVREGIRPNPKIPIVRNSKYYSTLHNYEWCLARSNENLPIAEIAELSGGAEISYVRRIFNNFNLPYKKLDTEFKKGITHITKGKKLEDVYSSDKVKEMKDNMSKAQKEYVINFPKNSICVNGHDKDVVGRTKEGKCKVCTGERTRAYYASHREEILEQKKDYDARMKLKSR